MDNKAFLGNLIKELSKPIPAQWRVQSFSKQKEIATVMAYIDARDCMHLLDQHAIYGWTRRHYEVSGKVYCEVGVYMPDGSIQMRSDCGVESNESAEKGQSSDSFKRACVNWGIGRFLYDEKVQYLKTNEKKSASNYPYCIDDSGQKIWDITEFVNKKGKKVDVRQAEPSTKEEAPKLPELVEGTPKYKQVSERLTISGTIEDVQKIYTLSPPIKAKLDLIIIERNKSNA